MLTLLIIVLWIWRRWRPKKEPTLSFHRYAEFPAPVDYEAPDSKQQMLEQIDFARWELGLEE